MKKIKILGRGIFALLFLLTIINLHMHTDVQAYTQMSNNLVACCDQYNNRVIVYNIGTHREFYRFNIPSAPKGYQKKYSPVDAKLRKHNKSGKTLLLITTGSRLYVVDYQTNKLIKMINYEFADKMNVHSLDMSKDGTLCVSDAVSEVIVFYKISKTFNISQTSEYYEQKTSHSVLYDAEGKSFWVAGYSNLYNIPISDSGSISSTATVFNFRSDFCDAHCIIQNPKDSNEIVISGWQGAISFNKNSYSQSWKSYYYGIKGMILFDNNLYYVRHQDEDDGAYGGSDYRSWTSSKLRLNGQIDWVYPDNAKVYKIIPFSESY